MCQAPFQMLTGGGEQDQALFQVWRERQTGALVTVMSAVYSQNRATLWGGWRLAHGSGKAFPKAGTMPQLSGKLTTGPHGHR